MKKNMGSTDKFVRLLVAVVVVYLAYSGTIPAPYAWVAYAVAAIFTLTSFVSFCPLYTLFGFSTCRR